MTSKEAKKILNEYRNRNYNSTLKDEVELAMAIDTVLPKYVELESRDTPMKVIKTPQERLFDLGFEKVAKHKFVKVNKGGSGYNTPYKITIEFAFNMYQVKCECENWIGVDLKLAEVLVDYLKELKNE